MLAMPADTPIGRCIINLHRRAVSGWLQAVSGGSRRFLVGSYCSVGELPVEMQVLITFDEQLIAAN